MQCSLLPVRSSIQIIAIKSTIEDSLQCFLNKWSSNTAKCVDKLSVFFLQTSNCKLYNKFRLDVIESINKEFRFDSYAFYNLVDVF